MRDSATVTIDASPAEVWALVSDVTRVGEYSPETLGAEWLGDADGPAEGARFRGHVKRNERGPTYWSVCRVVACEPERRFAFDVLGPNGAALNRWSFELEPDGDGTRLTESTELQQGLALELYANTVGRLRRRYNRRNLATSLGRIRAVLEGTEPPAQTARGPQRTMTVSAEVVVDAPAEHVWSLVADPTRIPEWSPENTGATTPRPGPLQVGDRFVGTNRRGPVRWATEAQVTASEPGRRFAFTVDRYGSTTVRVPVPIASWEFTFEPLPDGRTRVTETWFDDRRWPDAAAAAFDRVATGTTFADWQRGNIRRSLDRLATVATATEDAS